MQSKLFVYSFHNILCIWTLLHLHILLHLCILCILDSLHLYTYFVSSAAGKLAVYMYCFKQNFIS